DRLASQAAYHASLDGEALGRPSMPTATEVFTRDVEAEEGRTCTTQWAPSGGSPACPVFDIEPTLPSTEGSSPAAIFSSALAGAVGRAPYDPLEDYAPSGIVPRELREPMQASSNIRNTSPPKSLLPRRSSVLDAVLAAAVGKLRLIDKVKLGAYQPSVRVEGKVIYVSPGTQDAVKQARPLFKDTTVAFQIMLDDETSLPVNVFEETVEEVKKMEQILDAKVDRALLFGSFPLNC
ncbi:hypothetical protein CYMTET_5429, partial [Cymbomonas tetramitiformis]